MSAPPTVQARPRATIDLAALVGNYRIILDRLAGGAVAAMVKADGYGLGAIPVADALWAAGCRRFFVARLDEGIALRAALPEAEINVLDGVVPGTGPELAANDLVPIINSIAQLDEWRTAVAGSARSTAAGLHFDSGMGRLGIPADETDWLADHPDALGGIEIRHVMSHLASADVPGSPQSAVQLERFLAIRDRFPAGAASLANSAGVFLGPAYHFDLVRPGISLYGGAPFPGSGRPNPMQSVLTVEAPIIQVRTAAAGETIGYGATHRVTSPARIATVPVGYADGFLRSSSNVGLAAVAGRPVPIVGRVSMDLITLDVTELDDGLAQPGAIVELIGPNCPIDEVAGRAGSIANELLTILGRRLERRYVGRDRPRPD